MQRRKVLFIAMGNELRGDDAAPLLYLEKLKKEKYPEHIKTEFIYCGVDPSAFFEKIRKLKADIVIAIDTVDANMNPGAVLLLKKDDLLDKLADTHKFSIKIMADALKLPFYMIGVQPKTIELGANLSKECVDAYEEVKSKIFNLLLA